MHGGGEPAREGRQIRRMGARQAGHLHRCGAQRAQTVHDRTRLTDPGRRLGIDVDMVPIPGQPVERCLVLGGAQDAVDHRCTRGTGRCGGAAVTAEPARTGSEQRPGRDEVLAPHDDLEDRRRPLVPHPADRGRHGHLAIGRQRSQYGELLGPVHCGRAVECAARAEFVGSPLRERQGEGGQNPELFLENQVEFGGSGTHREGVEDGVAFGIGHGAGAEVFTGPLPRGSAGRAGGSCGYHRSLLHGVHGSAGAGITALQKGQDGR